MNLRAYLVSLTVLTGAGLAAPSTARAADPTTADCLAANNSAIDLHNDHKLREARNQLLVCAANSCPADIRKECLRKVDEVNAQIPTITFEAKDGATGKDLAAVKVTLDGRPLVDRLEGTALSVDPGEHTFSFEAEGQASITKQLVIIEAQKDRRETIVFGSPSQVPTTPRPPPIATQSVPPPPPSEASRGLGPQKIAAIAAEGVGVVGLAVGGAFGAVTLSQKNDAQSACPNLCSTQSGVQKWNNAVSSGNVATAFFIVGGVGVVGGAVLWFTAPSARGASTQVGVGPGLLQLKGTW